ncbi:MAG TPA: hypothetical protein DCX77_09280 [Acidimicrobiaceae bacterium]|nr:hypothetical protein [Acidimicrobiaceae bacterium]
MLSLKIGHRIIHRGTGRAGFVTGSSTKGWNRELVTVTLEGSTRSEDWPTSQVELRPSSEQLAIHGGDFVPPKGFPLNTV